jgi:hypothetical protein
MTLMKWTSWKTWLLVVPLALAAAEGKAGAVPGHARGTVFVADGAVGHASLSDRVAQIVNDAGLPINVMQVHWSTLHEGSDFQSQYNFTVKGKQLASRVLEARKACPTTKIFLVGIGAGTTVILKAVEFLPPNSVTDIVLLGTTVSCTYDLRPALSVSTQGVDSFYSPTDEALKIAIHRFGPTDLGVRGVTGAAGLTGFHALGTPDGGGYSRLRQYRLNQTVDRRFRGGHHAYTTPEFVRSKVVSIFEAALIGGGPHPAPSTPPTTPPPNAPPTPEPPQLPPTPAPKYSPPQTLAPQYPRPETPAPHYPRPETPTPHYPSPQTPTPQYPRPETPTTHYPSPQTPVLQYPRPETPTTHYPRPETPTTYYPRPETPTPHYPRPETPTPHYPVPETPTPHYPSPHSPAPQTPYLQF